MARVRIYNNCFCLACDKVKKKMMMVGPMVFCNSCFKIEFESIAKENSIDGYFVNSSCKKYIKWLHKYKEE